MHAWGWSDPLRRTRGVHYPGGPVPSCVAAGTIVALLAAFAAPGYLRGPAAEALRSYGYGPSVIEAEIRLLDTVLVAFPAAAAVTGGVLFAWDWLVRRFCRSRASGGVAQPITAGGFVLILLVVPLVVVELMALRGVPFLSSRNLLILAPVMALAVGLGVSSLLEGRVGALLAGWRVSASRGLRLSLRTDRRPFRPFRKSPGNAYGPVGPSRRRHGRGGREARDIR